MEYSISSPKTFRYEVKTIGENPQFILYALHGYGQLVKYFIRKFESINIDCVVVAPEGMHRFYLKGSRGRVGASWMTKEAREVDIADTNHFLEEVRLNFHSKFSNLPEILLGFSQGGATAARWNQVYGKFKAIILWGCVFPPDIDKAKIHLNGKDNDYFVIGSKDEYFDEKSQTEIQHFYKSIHYQVRIYDGIHDIHIETLNKILHEINLSK